MYRSAEEVALVPPEVVTTTSTDAPVVPAGEVTETVVAVLETIVAAVPPKDTAVGLARLFPVITTRWPPAAGPEAELSPVTTGKVP